MKNCGVLFFAILVITITGCDNKAAIQPDVDADIAALKNISSVDWNKNALAGNYEANVQKYLDDALRMDAEGILEGQTAIRDSMKDFHDKNKLTSCNNVVEDIKVSGDLGVIRGSFTGSYIPKEGGVPVNLKGPWIAVYERQQDGSWKSPFSLSAELND